MIDKPVILPIRQPCAIRQAASLVESGSLVAFPTDTVYGIGACAFQTEAVELLYQVKGRSHQKAIPILVSDLQDLEQVTPPLSGKAALLAEKFWPGPLTLVLPLLPTMPGNLSPSPTIGIRIPDHDLARQLLRVTGPLAATSANLSGEPPATTAEQVLQGLGGQVSLILDGGRSPGGLSSTVIDCAGEDPVLLREGPLAWRQIREYLARPS